MEIMLILIGIRKGVQQAAQVPGRSDVNELSH